MSHLYESVVKVTTTAAAQHIVTIFPATHRAEVREIGIFLTTTAALDIGLGRPAVNAAGTISGGQLVQALDPADAAGATILAPNNGANTTFGTTQPTAPTIPMRRVQLPAVAGAGVVWVWGPGELIADATHQLVVWQFAAAIGGFDVYAKMLE